jgi:hypothetical protein
MTFKLPAAITTSPEFVALNAHFWVAYAAVVTFPHVHWVFFAVLATAAVKEFIIDARWETPPQTALDNWSDFLGYAAGASIGMYVVL